ncbi:MAG: MopE-related protein [Pseudomonadota bacterium]|nr:MopE-related protein [Pseudomonadota bacterium]
MWWVAAAAAADMSFQCIDTATLPEHVLAWDDASSWGPVSDAWDLAYAWYDEACVTCTSDKSDWWEVCEAIACVTAAGAILDYHSEHSWSYRDTYDYTETTVTSITVAPPAASGLGWSTLGVTLERSRVSSTSASGGSSRDASVSWAGTLRADWPQDSGFTAGMWDHQNGAATSRGMSWDDGACAWRADTAVDWNFFHSVRMQGHTFEVTFRGAGECWTDYSSAYVDGVFVGVPDEDDWTLLGTDADGDGWPAEHGDCDDGDAATNPCTDDPYDGVDTNCDGATEFDFDHDGADGTLYGGDDCDDADPERYPDAMDIVCDAIDQDCDGADDRDADDDGDDCDLDCDDADPGRSSSTAEVLCDGVDQDCDGADACEPPAPEEEEPTAPADEEGGCGGGAAAGLLLLPLALAWRREAHGRRGPRSPPMTHP